MGFRASILIALCLSSVAAEAVRKNGFELDDSLVPPAEIRRGGPPRDGIPAIFLPKFSKEVDFLDDDDRVLGVVNAGVSKAFPVKILARHEVVNDWTQPEARMIVTYCPLCGSGMAFDVQEAAYGVSGLLYNSDVLLYDLATESLWSQILGKAISGPLRGQALTQIPLVHTTWQAWRSDHPGSWVLTPDTGYKGIDYRSISAEYRRYERSSRVWFPVSHRDKRFHPKEWVLGLSIGGRTKAYPFSELAKVTGLTDELGGVQFSVHFENDSAWAEDDAGNLLPGVRLFWFAWVGFHPETLVFTAVESAKDPSIPDR